MNIPLTVRGTGAAEPGGQTEADGAGTRRQMGRTGERGAATDLFFKDAN